MSQPDALFYALRHPNPERRKEAIVGVARQGNFAAIPVLKELAEGDPEPELQALARKAAAHLEKKLAAIPPKATVRSSDLKRSPPLMDPLGLDAEGGSTLAGADVLEAAVGTTAADEGGGWRKVRRGSRVRWALIMILAVITGWMFIRTGVLDSYLTSLTSAQWRGNLQREGEIDYYLFVPSGTMPSTGWGMIVALHENGRTAESLLPLFVDKAASAGMVLVVPTFGEYPQPVVPETTARLDAVLIRVRSEVQTDPAGAVVFGHGVGGEVAMVYARDYFGVGAVATYASPYLYAPPADDPILPYLVMYGQYDSLRGTLSEEINIFEAYDNPAQILEIPGAGRELPASVAEVVIELGEQLYAFR